MNCEQFEKYGMLYLSNELSKNDKQMFITHIKKCKVCQNKIEDYKLIEKQTNEQFYIPSSNIDKQILAEININSSKKTNKISLYSFMAAAIVAFFIFFTYSPSNLKLQNNNLSELDWNNTFFADSNFINNSLFDEINVLNDSMLVSFLDNEVMDAEEIIYDTYETINELDNIDDLIDTLEDIDII